MRIYLGFVSTKKQAITMINQKLIKTNYLIIKLAVVNTYSTDKKITVIITGLCEDDVHATQLPLR